jgi:branched-chain amino acid transport system permease protein
MFDDLRARWQHLKLRWSQLPERTRWAVTGVLEIVVVIVLGVIDFSLGVAAALLFAISWLPKIPPLPWRAGVEAAIVVLFLIFEPTLGIALAIGFAISWLPETYRGWPLRRWVLPLTVLVLAVLYPYFQENLFEVPVFGAWPSVDTAVTMVIYVMMALGLNIVVGYAGLLDLGYVAFYAMGAYTAAWLASPQFGLYKVNIHFGAVGINPKLAGIHISIWLVLIAAAVLTALVGVIIGLPTLRLRGDYLAIVTLGFGEIMPQVARNGDNLGGFNLTNGAQGVNPIDPPGFGSVGSAVGLPNSFVEAGNSTNVYYWTGIALLLFTIFCAIRLRGSRLGRAWIAIREDETAAAAMGIPLMRTKTWAYAAGAFFGGIAGAYYASYKGGTFPDDFSFNISVFILCMVILGGMGTIWGVIVGGAFLAYVNQEGLGNIGGWLDGHFGLTVDVPLYASGIFGIILVVVMLFRPQGLIGERRRRAELEGNVHDQPLYEVRG